MSSIMSDTEASNQFNERVSGIVGNGFIAMLIAMGNKLKLFDELAKGTRESGKTAKEVAQALNLKERYVQEWIGGMASAQIIDVSQDYQHFYIPESKSKCLSYQSGATTGLFSWLLPICGGAYDDVVSAFQKDGPLGVPYSKYPMFHNFRNEYTTSNFPTLLEKHIYPNVPDIVSNLNEGNCSMLDIGCSEGILLFLLAEKFPSCNFIGIDLCQDAIEKAQLLAVDKGLSNTRFEAHDACALPDDWTNQHDYVIIYDSVHDMGRPDLAMKEVHRVLKPGGKAIIVDIDADSSLEENMKNPSTSVLYAISLMHCMPCSLQQGEDALGLGAVWGVQKATKLMQDAGFATVDLIKRTNDQQAIFLLQK